jgi:hypothetical protein
MTPQTYGRISTYNFNNSCYVAIDIGGFQEALRAIERIFQIRIEKDDQKARAVDFETLEICVKAIIEDIKDASGVGASALAPRLKSILELMASRMSSAQLYTVCAKFYSAQNLNRISLDYAQKAYRLVLNNPYILEKEIAFKQLSHVTLGLVDAYALLGPMTEEVRMGGSEEVICKDWQ